MEEMSLATTRPSRSRTVTENFQAAAWRAPTAPRFDSRPANDVAQRDESVDIPETKATPEGGGIPRWFIAIAGGLIVAMLAVFAANAMAL